jgi:hypothetical protein
MTIINNKNNMSTQTATAVDEASLLASALRNTNLDEQQQKQHDDVIDTMLDNLIKDNAEHCLKVSQG